MMLLLEEEDAAQEEQAKPLKLALLRHQAEFVNDTTTRELALVGGFGCGKTEALCYKAITLAALNAPFVNSDTVNFLIEPSDSQIRDLLRPRFEKILVDLNIPFTLRLAPRVTYALHFQAGDVKIVMAPAGAGADSFRGFEAAFIGVDEADTIDPDRLRELWVSLTSRLRGCKEGALYQLFATTTPEGFNFCYQNWVEDIEVNPDRAEHRRLVRGKTKWNPYLPKDYIANLERQYPDAAGRQMSTNADESNLMLLKKHFTVLAHNKNPRVSDRVTSVNARFCNGANERKYFVNIKKCPVFTKSLEQQKYRNGEPDKKHDQDHPVDAAGYFIWFCYPLRHPSVRAGKLAA